MITVQGRQLSPGDIDDIRTFIREHPGWSRRRLSIELSKRRAVEKADPERYSRKCAHIEQRLDSIPNPAHQACPAELRLRRFSNM